ncbi:hypothetical protein EFM38_07555 [Lentilactobacillus buchneri]|nr:hypothetical protein [Lentilactobacillus buchneri]MCT3541685.1 hypothetical protein [Lentilactobacillus buchneri]MCT3543924.1 hypothetical protein [Lentilactobacillus buchneri]MCT3553027.1 hypothetical protein [Lentilactobacillus buchneri]
MTSRDVASLTLQSWKTTPVARLLAWLGLFAYLDSAGLRSCPQKQTEPGEILKLTSRDVASLTLQSWKTLPVARLLAWLGIFSYLGIADLRSCPQKQTQTGRILK